MKCLDDARIIELFLAGDESALRETELKYGGELKSLSYRITGSKEDAAECFNDTLLKAWESISEAKPKNLRAYLCRIARNCLLNCVKKKTAKKESPARRMPPKPQAQVTPKVTTAPPQPSAAPPTESRDSHETKPVSVAAKADPDDIYATLDWDTNPPINGAPA